MANAPNTRFSATNVRVKEPNGGVGLSKATSNGEVEGPPRSARSSVAGAYCLSSASDADTQGVHGPLQRLLGGWPTLTPQ